MRNAPKIFPKKNLTPNADIPEHSPVPHEEVYRKQLFCLLNWGLPRGYQVVKEIEKHAGVLVVWRDEIAARRVVVEVSAHDLDGPITCM
jgi:hypothetical protein